MRRTIFAALLLLTPSALLAHTPEEMRAAADLDAERLRAADQEEANWLAHGRTYDEQRFSPLDQIDADNVSDLGLAWFFETDHKRGMEASPIVIDGVMYSTGSWSVVFAHDARTGELLWRHDPKVDRARGGVACCDVVNRGVAVWKGRVYVGTLDGYLVALDAGTGQQIWRTLTVDLSRPYTITGAPRVVKGKVIIGNGGAELGVRGYVSAYDAETGEMVWRFFTVPGNPELPPENEAMARAMKTWDPSFPWWENGGGGTVWDSMAYDPELDQLYVGVGNAGPWNRYIRNPKGLDNLYLSSIVALDPDTGEYIWHYQGVPNEGFDFTMTQHMILADIEWKGAPRKVLLQAPKNGFFFVLDRETGEFLSAEPYSRQNWALGYDANGRPIESPEADYSSKTSRIRPSPFGAHNWHPMSYSPLTGLVYIPAMELMAPLEYEEPYVHQPGFINLGLAPFAALPTNPVLRDVLLQNLDAGELVAWNPVEQRAEWRVRHVRAWNGGVLATAGNLVFQGTAEQKFKAYRADTGQELWSFDAQTGVIAPPVSYRVDGEQYVVVQAGWGGGWGLAGGLKPPPSAARSRILAFKLGGQAELPPVPKPVLHDPPPRMDVSDEVVEEGERLYSSYCLHCHGIALVSSDAIPDLRYMSPERHEAFDAIVLGGALRGVGMIGFEEVLDEREAAAIHAYILDEANAAKERRDDPPWEWWVELQRWLYERGAWIIDRWAL